MKETEILENAGIRPTSSRILVMRALLDCDGPMSLAGLDDDLHVHFYCERCHRVYCFDSIATPVVDIPAGFAVRSINYMLKGVCPACSGRTATA